MCCPQAGYCYAQSHLLDEMAMAHHLFGLSINRQIDWIRDSPPLKDDNLLNETLFAYGNDSASSLIIIVHLLLYNAGQQEVNWKVPRKTIK